MIRFSPLFCRAAFTSLALLLLTACETTSTKKVAKLPPPPPAQNYFAPPAPGAQMRRVAMLPLASERIAPDGLRDVTTAFVSELSKKGLFEVVPVTPTALEEITGQRQLSSSENLPADLLARLRDKYGAEGILFTDVTHLNSYRPVSIGVRAKLVDAASGRIRWAYEYTYDSGHPAIAEKAKEFQRQFADEHRPIADDGGSVLLSPSRFAKFVASDTFASLQRGQ
jgi:hypothetical protein